MKLKDLKPSARIWIYQSNRKLTEQECSNINSAGQSFVENWSAHGSSLQAAIEVLHEYFVVVAVDEQVANATGCSIDKSVHFIQDIGTQCNVDFFNRLNVVVELEDSNELKLFSISELEEALKKGNVSKDAKTFDNTMSTLGELFSKWETPLRNSWVARQVLIS